MYCSNCHRTPTFTYKNRSDYNFWNMQCDWAHGNVDIYGRHTPYPCTNKLGVLEDKKFNEDCSTCRGLGYVMDYKKVSNWY